MPEALAPRKGFPAGARGSDETTGLRDDTKYREPVGFNFQPLDAVEQDGRSFRVKLTYRL